MSAKDSVSREKAGQLMECGTDMERLENWLQLSPITVSQLPMAIIGSGNSDLAAKVEALFHSAKLDRSSSPAELERYCQSCISFCTDYGTEVQIPEDGKRLEIFCLCSATSDGPSPTVRDRPTVTVDRVTACDGL